MSIIRFKPQEGFESEYTQSLANTFPPWHKIRYDPTATGQYMLNALSQGVSEIHQYIKNARRNMFIGTADTLVRIDAYRCEIPQQLELRAPREHNMLRNSSFVDPGAAFWNKPLEWQVTSGEFCSTDAYAGHGSIKLSPNGSAYQVISGDQYHKGQEYTAGVWVKSSATGETSSGNITITATGWGWTQESSEDFAIGTTGEWAQRLVSITPTGEIRTFTVAFSSTPTGEVDAFYSAPMLSEGSTLQSWQPGPDDSPASEFRVYMAGPTGETRQYIEMKEVFNDYDLFEDALPTRLDASPGITGDLLSDNYAPPVFEWTKDLWDCELRVSGDYIERYSVRVQGDVWNQYSVLDRYMDNEVNTGEYGFFTGEYDGFTRTLEALCVWRHRIYLVAKESYGDDTYRVLKILRWQGVENRLETIHDIRIGMDTGDVSSVGFVDGRMDQMGLVMDDDATWTMQLYYDKFFYDGSRRQVVLRHPYEDFTLMFAEL